MRKTASPCRPTTASLVAALVSLALLAIAAPAQADDCGPAADAQPGQATQDQLAGATICLLNEQRTAAGLAPLAPSAPLGTTAQKYSDYMVSEEHFAHQDEDGHNVVWRVLQTDPALANRWQVIGENLGWGTYNMATPRAMVQGWMNSPTHRDNILYPRYDEIGVGVANGAPQPGTDGALTYATVFGKVAPPAPKKKPRAKHAKSCKRPSKRVRSRAARLRAKRAYKACAARARAARNS